MDARDAVSGARARRGPFAFVEGPRDRERVRSVLLPDHDDLARLLADRIVATIQRETATKGRCVLGLATGSTPLGVYQELIRRYEAGEVDFARVLTLNLDEYYPIAPDSPRSFRPYMLENFFAQVNVPAAPRHIPHRTLPRARLSDHLP